MTDISTLNERQRAAVTHTEGPLLVLAGAGSGKTRVLTYRIAYLIENNFAAPWNVLAITFTNKAAAEMARRVEELIGAAANDMWVKTFHSACVRILRREIEHIGYKNGFNIIDADDQKKTLKECLSELNISDRELPVKSVMSAISSAKDSLLDPEAYAQSIAGEYRMEVIAKIYALYQKKLKTANCLDFDDLITMTVRLFREHPDVLEVYRKKFRYILVDEYQDTNNAQNALILLLAQEHRNLCVVGDDDQSIYKFRGANIQNILNFEKAFSECTTIRLEQNYRSTQNILDAANTVIKHNTSRKGKNLWTDAGCGDKITVKRARNERDEAAYIADEIEKYVADGYKYADMAILYRANSASRSLEEVFMYRALPYRVLAGLRFYDRMEIRDMVAYLRLIRNNDDDISLKRIINTPPRKIGKVTLDNIAAVAARENTSMLEAIRRNKSEMKESVAGFADLIDRLTADSQTAAIDILVESVFTQSGYSTFLESDPKGEDRAQNIGELISGAKNYADNFPEATFSDYMDSIALISDIDNYDENMDAVVLLTVHAAKGLEFPIVFVCGMDEGVFPSMMSQNDIEDLEEERRLCYVAITRAQKILELTGAQCRTLYGKTSGLVPSRFEREIPDDLKNVVEEATAVFGEYDFQPRSTGSNVYVPPKPKTYSGDTTLRPGDIVTHKKFGRGCIVLAEPVGNDVRYEVAFDSVGTKSLLGLYANLKKE
ncbi:MAG: UvrD-helicase domain-containing protein [Clostridia bacterium]|nr:UvrD-helicase domain-containing protein [Clostridia bacterium]